jgi:hypothetical protein
MLQWARLMTKDPTAVEQGAAGAFVYKTPLAIGSLIDFKMKSADIDGKLAIIRHANNKVISWLCWLVRIATLSANLDFHLPWIRPISDIRIGQ